MNILLREDPQFDLQFIFRNSMGFHSIFIYKGGGHYVNAVTMQALAEKMEEIVASEADKTAEESVA